MSSTTERPRHVSGRGAAATPPPASRPGRRSGIHGNRFEPYLFIAPTVLLVAALLVIPIVTVIGYSLADNVITNKSPQFVGIENYLTVLGDPRFAKATLNTLFFTVTSVVAHLVLGLGFAMLLNTQLLSRFSIAIYRTIFVLPWLFTAAVIAVLWRLLLNPNGVVNWMLSAFGAGQIEWLGNPSLALGAVTFINIWAGYPFFMISLLAGLQGIPRDLYEAATVDGAGAWQRFRHVTLPQLRPLIISIALLDLIWTSQQFALIWMTTGGGPIDATEMLSTFTYKLAFSRYEFSLASTSAVVVLVLSMVLAFYYVRHQRARD